MASPGVSLSLNPRVRNGPAQKAVPFTGASEYPAFVISLRLDTEEMG